LPLGHTAWEGAARMDAQSQETCRHGDDPRSNWLPPGAAFTLCRRGRR